MEIFPGPTGRRGAAQPDRLRRRRLLTVVVVTAFAVVLASCGGGGGSSASTKSGSTDRPVAPGARVINVTARSFSFTPDQLVVHAGEKIALRLHAVDAYHTFAIEGYGHVVGASAGTTRTGGFSLQHPGRYTFYCEEPGHRAAGMVGTITVVS